jgi:radical SAM superfamily enzyme YgiQ (UPF0313 family)
LAKVVLTFDRTMASNYHGLMFLGFSACLPQGTLPDWFFYSVFTPTARTYDDGKMVNANYGSRKIEAALLANGFKRDDVVIVHPDHIDKFVTEETKIVGLTVIDPLGIGPATSTFTKLWGGEGRMAVKLRKLLNSKSIKKHKPTIVAGGPGSWQLSNFPEKRVDLGIDYVVIGEGDITAPKLFNKILNNESDIETISYGEVATEKDIPDIVGGSTIGTVEITRGCARSCAFCVPTLKKVRSMPVENILKEAAVNVEAGNTGVILHAEDVLLYKSDGLKVNSEAVVDLFTQVKNSPGINWVGASHASLSSIASAPEAIEGMSKILGYDGKKGSSHGFFEVGIESGSPRIIKKHMNGKAYPFKADQWPDVVRDGFKVCHENHFINSGTLILGLPDEQPEDIQMTIDLVKTLKPYKSLLVPLLFAPMETSRLEYAKSLTKEELTTLHHELITTCWEHNLEWLPEIWNDYSHKSSPVLRTVINAMMKLGTPYVRRKMYASARRNGVDI